MAAAHIEATAPNPPARIAAVCYLMNFVTGMIALLATSKVIVHGNTAATTANIVAHASAYWLGFAAYVLLAASYTAVTALFYQLFKPVNKTVSLVAAAFSIVGCAIVAVSCGFYVAPSLVVAGTPYASAFGIAQTQAQAGLFLRLFAECFNVSFPFFGFYCLLIGYLVFRSTFLPRILGVLLAIAGLGWLTFLWPPLVKILSPWIVAGGLGELMLTLWLLVRGVDVERWREMALANRQAGSG